MTPAQDVLTFWFEAHGQGDWFGGRPEFDAAITEKFTETHRAVARGEAWSWRATPQGRLAEIVVLDQFSRQLFRGAGKAFAADGMALALAQEAVGGGHQHFLPPTQRLFVLLPFMHAESPLVQQDSLRLHTALGMPDMLAYAQRHAEVVARFGRFPRRNAALGRASTPEEEAYIAATQNAF